MDISGFLRQIVSITQFNKGKASQLFSRVSKGETLLVIKNNSPIAVIISPEKYEILCKFPKLCIKESENKHDIISDKFEDLLEELKSFEENGEEYVQGY